MYIKNGEVRKIGIEVVSQLNQDFIIEAADFTITKSSGELVEQGIPTIDGHKILTLFTAVEKGRFYVTFKYHIGPEILKAESYMEVL